MSADDRVTNASQSVLSVIILTRDRKEKLSRCLEALLPQLSRDDEVLIVDTGSADDTLEFVRSFPDPHVKLRPFTGPGSWAEARNFGVAQARGSLIAFLDDDCYPSADWAERGRAALTNSDAAGGLVLPMAGRSWPEWWHPEMGWLIGLSVPGHLGPEAGRYYYPFTANLWARAFLLRAEPFQELGGSFKSTDGSAEQYQTGREDAEWWRRIRVRGYQTRFDSSIRVEHDIDPARIDFNYLLQRARRDGEAWARREGLAEDLDPLAYRWWQTKVPGRTVAGVASDASPFAMRRLRQLDVERQRAALEALSEKIARSKTPGDSAQLIRTRAVLHASARVMRDRAKTMARRVVLASSRRRAPPIPPSPHKIGVAAFGFVGDMVILQSVLRGVVWSHPDIEISLLAPSPATAIFRGLSRIRLTLLPPEFQNLENAQSIIANWIGTSRPELILAPYLHLPWGPAFARLGMSGLPIVAFDRDEGLARQIDRDRIPYKCEKVMTDHEAKNLLRLFDKVEIQADPLPPEIQLLPAIETRVRTWLGEHSAVAGKPLLMLNPDAGKPNKEWPDESWLKLIEGLLDDLPHTMVINASRIRASFVNAAKSAFGSTPRLLWLNQAPLDDLIAVMALCDGIITVDAGPQHLAHALGLPSLTLYGPMDERRWTDLWQRPIHQTIRGGSYDLTPEELRGLPENHLMRLIQPEAVRAKVRGWLAQLSK